MEFQNQNSENNLSDSSLSPVQKKSYWKFVLSFLAIIILLFVGYPLLRTFYDNYVAKRGFDAYFAAEKEYMDYLKNDKYGGKTPEEAYFMYLDALKKGDISLASKYYIGAEGPGRAYKWLTQMQQKGWLEDYVNELPTDWLKMREKSEDIYWMKDAKKFVYDYVLKKDRIISDYATGEGSTSTFPAGKYEGSIIFRFSQPAHIWKIEE